MALSEQERKRFEEIEASLREEDPSFAESVSREPGAGVDRRRVAIGGIGFVIGVVVLLAGIQYHPLISIGGFILMLACSAVGLSSWQRAEEEEEEPRPKAAAHKQAFLDRLNERDEQA